MILKRTDFLKTGVFGELLNDDSSLFCQTLEHAYPDMNGPTYQPKIPPGVYTCVRGMHILAGMSAPFETFEITNVPGHTDILFHVGNVNADSSGCVLLGRQRGGDSEILESKIAFESFMAENIGVDSFLLTVL